MKGNTIISVYFLSLNSAIILTANLDAVDKANRTVHMESINHTDPENKVVELGKF